MNEFFKTAFIKYAAAGTTVGRPVSNTSSFI